MVTDLGPSVRDTQEEGGYLGQMQDGRLLDSCVRCFVRTVRVCLADNPVPAERGREALLSAIRSKQPPYH
jgi:hypothetical protein